MFSFCVSFKLLWYEIIYLQFPVFCSILVSALTFILSAFSIRFEWNEKWSFPCTTIPKCVCLCMSLAVCISGCYQSRKQLLKISFNSLFFFLQTCSLFLLSQLKKEKKEMHGTVGLSISYSQRILITLFVIVPFFVWKDLWL